MRNPPELCSFLRRDHVAGSPGRSRLAAIGPGDRLRLRGR